MARKRRVLYRLDVDYYSREYENKCCEISSPIYNKKEGLEKYKKAIAEKCIDNPEIAARVHLWKYRWDDCGKCVPLTIAKNY